MLFRSIRFCSFQFDCFSSAAFIFCSSITSCNWGHLSVLPNPVCTSTKMHQNASKVRKFVVKKLQILHKTLLSWSHACILRKRTSPLQRQFEDYTENNSHHHQKCKIVEETVPYQEPLQCRPTCFVTIEFTILRTSWYFGSAAALRQDEGDVHKKFK